MLKSLRGLPNPTCLSADVEDLRGGAGEAEGVDEDDVGVVLAPAVQPGEGVLALVPPDLEETGLERGQERLAQLRHSMQGRCRPLSENGLFTRRDRSDGALLDFYRVMVTGKRKEGRVGEIRDKQKGIQDQ